MLFFYIIVHGHVNTVKLVNAIEQVKKALVVQNGSYQSYVYMWEFSKWGYHVYLSEFIRLFLSSLFCSKLMNNKLVTFPSRTLRNQNPIELWVCFYFFLCFFKKYKFNLWSVVVKSLKDLVGKVVSVLRFYTVPVYWRRSWTAFFLIGNATFYS